LKHKESGDEYDTSLYPLLGEDRDLTQI